MQACRCLTPRKMLMRCLQDFLLYAIVLCDSAQRSTDAQPSAGGTAHSSAAPEAQAAASASLPAADVGAMAGAGPPQLAESQSRHAAEAPMTAAEARRALRLYQASAGKYAAGGSAFMAPVYGVGELPQVCCACGPFRNGAVPIAAICLTLCDFQGCLFVSFAGLLPGGGSGRRDIRSAACGRGASGGCGHRRVCRRSHCRRTDAALRRAGYRRGVAARDAPAAC